jgi:hypothetical protein
MVASTGAGELPAKASEQSTCHTVTRKGSAQRSGGHHSELLPGAAVRGTHWPSNSAVCRSGHFAIADERAWAKEGGLDDDVPPGSSGTGFAALERLFVRVGAPLGSISWRLRRQENSRIFLVIYIPRFASTWVEAGQAGSWRHDRSKGHRHGLRSIWPCDASRLVGLAYANRDELLAVVAFGMAVQDRRGRDGTVAALVASRTRP